MNRLAPKRRTTDRVPLDGLATFAAVARASSFTRAAAELRVSTSALSHAVKVLEERLGLRLLQRNSRSVAVTAAGARLMQELDPALGRIDRALDALARDRDELVGCIRLTMTRHAFETIVRPVLPAFLAAHPRARVEVLIDYRLRDVIADRLDAGIRIGEKLEQDMVAVRVGPDLRMAVVASPAYLARHAAPRTPQGLRAHRCINTRMMASGQIYAWEFEKRGRAFEVKTDGSLVFNDPGPTIDAVLDGLGIAYLLEGQVAAYLVDGALVRLLESWTAPFVGYHLYYPSHRQTPPVLAALIEALRQNRDLVGP